MRWFNGEPFERVVGIISSVIILTTACVAYLETTASSAANRAERTAQQIVIENMGLRARGEIDFSYASGDALRLWDVLDTRAFVAEARDDIVLADAYLAAREAITALTPLFQPPYFDEADGFPAETRYRAEIYLVEQTYRAEQFSNFSNIEDQWERKSQNYVAQLTILAVALFLFSLSNTIPGGTRWIFVVFGGLLFVITLGWTLLTVQTAVTSLPDAALRAYAEGRSLLVAEAYTEATRLLDEAIALAPTYADAYAARAEAHGWLGNTEREIEDYNQAIALGNDSADVLTSLSFAYYLSDDIPSARQTAQERLQRPTALPLDHFDLGLFALVEGDLDAALGAYRDGVALTAAQVDASRAGTGGVPTALLGQLETATFDLRGVADCIDFDFCDGVPASLVADPAVAETSLALNGWLRDVLLAIEYDQPTPAYQPDRELAVLDFYALEAEQPSDLFDTNESNVEVGEPGLATAPGQPVVVKALIDGDEDFSLRLVTDTSANEPLVLGGGADTIFGLLPGEYLVEYYLDYQLAATGYFLVE